MRYCPFNLLGVRNGVELTQNRNGKPVFINGNKCKDPVDSFKPYFVIHFFKINIYLNF